MSHRVLMLSFAFVEIRGGSTDEWPGNGLYLGFEVMHERNAHNFPLDLA